MMQKQLQSVIKILHEVTQGFQVKSSTILMAVLEVFLNILLWIIYLPFLILTIPILCLVFVMRNIEALIFHIKYKAKVIPTTDILWSFYNTKNQPYINGFITIDGCITVNELCERFSNITKRDTVKDGKRQIEHDVNDVNDVKEIGRDNITTSASNENNTTVNFNNENHGNTNSEVNNPNQHGLYRLMSYVKSGFLNQYWFADKTFSLSNHISMYETEYEVTEDNLNKHVGFIVSQPLLAFKVLSPWHIFIIHYGDTSHRKTALVFKLSHYLADGTSLAYFLIRQLSDSKDVEIPIKKFSQNKYNLLWFKGILNFPLTAMKLLLIGKDNNIFHLKKITGEKSACWTQPINLDEIKYIKNELKCSVNDVLFGALKSTFERYFTEQNTVEHTKLQTLFPVDIRSSIDEAANLSNQFATLVIELVPTSLRSPNSQSRDSILKTHKMFQKVKTSGQPFGIQLSWQLISYLLPSCFIKAFLYNTVDKTTAVTSNLIGPQNSIFMFDKRVELISFWAPTTTKQTLSFSFCTYNKTFCLGVLKDDAIDLELNFFTGIFRGVVSELSETITKSKLMNQETVTSFAYVNSVAVS